MSRAKNDWSQLSIDELEAVDHVCIRFEDEWVAGRSPNINDFLNNTNADLTSAVLVELVRLDVEYRTQLGQTPEESEYESSFPNEALAIRSAFSKFRESNQAEHPENESASNASTGLPFEKVQPDSEFKIKRFHARGGLGEIFLAHDIQLNRTVAIKVPRNRDPGSAERIRLKREAEVTGRLKHPGIVPVHAACHDEDELPYYVMQFVEGQTFRDAINAFHESNDTHKDKFSSWEFRRLLQRLISVCNTVAYVHQQGLIHRDIKPGNIMLGEFGETFLLDWGLAKHFGQDKSDTNSESILERMPTSESWRNSIDQTAASTKPGQPIGTPEFASPEQVQGKVQEQDGRSDVYSLGATLYYLLMGKGAIELDDLTDLSTASAIRDIAPPKSVDSNVPVDLNSICMKAICFDAADRYQSATEFSEDLERFLADEPIRARRETWPTRVRRWTKKNPKTAYTIASGMTVALVAFAISSWFFSQQADELESALSAQETTSRELKTARKSADANADKAKTALRTMSDRVVLQWFARQRHFSENERQFLEEILEQYLEFGELDADEFSNRQTRAEGWQTVGQIQDFLGKTSDAMVSFGKAVELLTPLPGSSNQLHSAKATSEFSLGSMLFYDGNIKGGLNMMGDAVNSFKLLAKENPESSEYKFKLAQKLESLGGFFMLAIQSDVSLKLRTDANNMYQELLELEPENVAYLACSISNLTGLAMVHSSNGETEKAIKKHREAIRIHEQLDKQNAVFSDLNRASAYAMSLSGLARVLNRSGSKEDARETYRQAINFSKRLTSMFPSYPSGFLHLGNAYRGLCGSYFANQDYAEAAKLARLAADAGVKAVEMSPKVSNHLVLRSEAQQSYAVSLWLNGDLEDAEAAYQQGVIYARETHEVLADMEPGSLLTLARLLSGLAQTQYALGKTVSAIKNFDESVGLLESGKDSKVFGNAQHDALKTMLYETMTTLCAGGDFQNSLRYSKSLMDLSLFPQQKMEVRVIQIACLAELEPESAVKEIQSLMEEKIPSKHLYKLAESAARSAGKLSDGETDGLAIETALKLLKQADDAGFFKLSQTVNSVRDNDAFESIRGHEKFKAILESLNQRN